MSQSVRIQFIIRCLNHKGGVSLNEITSAFEVSRRQAARDIEYLRDQMHAPVSYNWKTKKYQLTSIWESYTNTDERMIIMGAYLKSLFSKIKLGKYFEQEILTSLYSGISDDVRRVLDRVEYRSQNIDVPDWETLSTIIDAFCENTCVEIEYSSLKDEISERKIEPRKLINYNNTWYVIAYDHRREDVRTFHLSRILSARTTGEPMTHDIQISDSGYGIYLTGSLAEYRIRFTGNAARIVSTQVWSSDQKMEYPGDGSLLLTVKSSSIEELVPAVLSFGDEAEPVSPKSFVDSYKAKVRALAFREGLSNQSC